MTLSKDTKISIGTAVVMVAALIPAAVQLHNLKVSVWTVEDQQNWADHARKHNPTINVPEPNEIRRMRRSEINTLMPNNYVLVIP
jgi:hypothetical protein